MKRRFDNISDTFMNYENTTIQPHKVREAKLHHLEWKIKEYEDSHGKDLQFLKKLTQKLLLTIDQSFHGNDGLNLIKLVHKYLPEENPMIDEEENRLFHGRYT